MESSVYLILFLVVYRLAIARQTHFAWMRVYLLLSLFLSVVLPFITLPSPLAHSMVGQSFADGSFAINVLNPYAGMTSISTSPSSLLASYSNPWATFLMVVTFIYFLGALYKSVVLFGNVKKILTTIKRSSRHKEGAYWFVNTDIELPAFSFFNFIFINQGYKNLTHDDLVRIKNHELIHANQGHTLDILFVEMISIVFWFNPLLIYTKNRLQEIHEFIADKETAGQGELKKNYAQLLFNLATETKSINLMTGFSGKQISKRISMVSQKRSLGWSKLLYILLFPVAFVILLAFSYLENPTTQDSTHKSNAITSTINSVKVRNIKWVNNTVISSAELDKVLGLKKGDEYVNDKKDTERTIYTERVLNYYLDKGYVFANVEMAASPVNESEVDLSFTVFEGSRGKIGTVKVTGNKTISTDEILSRVTVKPGDLFSKTQLIESVKVLSKISKLDPEEIKPLVTPEIKDVYTEFYTVNIVFEVVEK